jgi:hypothetical protein
MVETGEMRFSVFTVVSPALPAYFFYQLFFTKGQVATPGNLKNTLSEIYNH